VFFGRATGGDRVRMDGAKTRARGGETLSICRTAPLKPKPGLCGPTRRSLTAVICIVTLYAVIRSFRHRGVERFFRTGSKAGIQPKHAARLRLQLFALDNAKAPSDMNAAGWSLHALREELAGHWAIRVSGNWRLTFKFEDEDAILVDYQDYH
jgi:toxin HigB-1